MMRKAVKYILVFIAFFLVGLMFYASFSKMGGMMAVRENPELFNKRSIEYHYRHNQVLSYAHIILGLIFLLTGSYQFIPFFRNRSWKTHRAVGKVFLASSLVVSLSAIIMAIWFPFSDIIETITTIVYGTFLLAGTYLAFLHARNRNIPDHRAWVLRVFFVGLSIATIRIVAGVGMVLTGNTLKEMLGISFGIAFTLHLIVVEGWIRFTRR